MTKEQYIAKFGETLKSMYACCYPDGITEQKFNEIVDYEYSKHVAHYQRVDKALQKSWEYCEKVGRTYVDETTFNTFFKEV